MSTKKWITAILCGILIAIVVSSAFTYRDWCLNPGGIFYSDDQGTQWSIVWDTWISWFLPVALVGAGLCLVAVYVYNYLR